MLSRLKCPEGIQLLVVERRTCRQGLCQRRKMGGARGGCVAGVHDSARCTGGGRASQHAQDLKTMTARRKCSRRGSQAVALRTWLSRGSVGKTREQCSLCKGPFCEHFDGALLTSGVNTCNTEIHPRS